MKVLFYLHSMGAGGAERVTAILANYWVDRGREVIVATNVPDTDDFYALDSRIERVTLNAAQSSENVCAAIRHNWRRIRALRRLLKRRAPDVAIAMMTSANCILALAGFRSGLRLVGSERIHPPHFPLSAVWRHIRKITYPRLDCVVAQTEQSGGWLTKHVPGTRVAVIPNPVQVPMEDAEPDIDPANVIDDLENRHLLIAVGRLEPQKGFDQLVAAFAAIKSEVPDWVLAILGDGRSRPELEQQAAALGVANRVAMPGSVGNIGRWYAAADLFVLSSRFEGFPNCLLEAMAHGITAVTFDCETGPAQIIRDGIDGVLVKNGDEGELSRAMHALMSDHSKRKAMGEQAATVVQRFSVRHIAANWDAVIQPGNASGRSFSIR